MSTKETAAGPARKAPDLQSEEFKARVEQYAKVVPRLRLETQRAASSGLVRGERVELPVPFGGGGTTEAYQYPAEEGGCAPVVFNLHGGGFALGDALIDDLACDYIRRNADVHVVNINYCKAPEHPFPQALDQIYDVLRLYAAGKGPLDADARRFVLMGFSAGANLASGTALRARGEQAFDIVAQVLHYPFLDALTSSWDKDPQPWDLSPETMEVFNEMYAPASERANPLVSPACAQPGQLQGLPPTLLLPAERDALCPECDRYRGLLEEAGVDVCQTVMRDAHHGYVEECFSPAASGHLRDEARACRMEGAQAAAEKALALSASFINKMVNPKPTQRAKGKEDNNGF